jgi:hypothetical protein
MMLGTSPQPTVLAGEWALIRPYGYIAGILAAGEIGNVLPTYLASVLPLPVGS